MPPRILPHRTVDALRCLMLTAALSGMTAAWAATPPPAAGQGKLLYNEHIQPILAEYCFHCHGPDSATREARLRLDRAEDATQPRGARAPAIVPGKPAESLVIERIVSEFEDEVMPPPGSHKTLSPGHKTLLRRWIEEGAEYEPHWAFLAPRRPVVPEAPLAKGWVRNPIDAFVAEKLAENGLKPGREETPTRLLRRVTLDLTGLPPTPEEQLNFEADRAPGAYERVVDRLLASDAAAEHLARYWLDAVRYADTHGIHVDSYRSIWPYRDWVIDAYRRNLPFDQFTIEQIAGDMLPGATLDQQVASGFNRCLPTTNEAGVIAAEYEAIYAKDRVETLSAIWLGLTTGCAACHDHKFDPVTAKDFYSLTAFFRNNTMPVMDGNIPEHEPTLLVPAGQDRGRWPGLQKEIAAARRELQARGKAAGPAFSRWLETATRLAPPAPDPSVKLHRPLVARDEAAPQGPFGPAVSLAEGGVVLGESFPLTEKTEMSFGFYLRIEGAPSGTLLAALSDGDTRQGWELRLKDGKIGYYLADGGDVVVESFARTALEPGEWHHVLFYFDGRASRYRLIDVLVDGKATVPAPEPRDLSRDVMPTGPLTLGARTAKNGSTAAAISGGAAWVQDLRHQAKIFRPADTKPMTDALVAATALAKPDAERKPAERAALLAHYLATADGPALAIAAKLDRLLAEERAIAERGGVTLVMKEKENSEPFAHVLNRGEYSQPGEKVPAATPGVLPPLGAGQPANRLGLARWLVAPENPLTARVTANRMWQQIFGLGIVETPADFGVMGARPSHPKLLDWLAVEFRETGWDQRKLLRLLVTSATYRQSAAATRELLERDPDNRLLARGPRHRLDAEVLRDQALAVAGLLVSRIGGPPVRPYQPEGIWEEVSMKQSTTRFYQQDSGDNLYRRSLYTLWKRTAAPPAMEILNAPSREVSCVRRDRTNTPLQAFVTLNETAFVESARQLAARTMREGGTFELRADGIARRVLGRGLSGEERATLRRLFVAAEATYRSDPAAARALLAVGASPADPRHPPAELAAWTLVASQVMNLDEALTK